MRAVYVLHLGEPFKSFLKSSVCFSYTFCFPFIIQIFFHGKACSILSSDLLTYIWIVKLKLVSLQCGCNFDGHLKQGNISYYLYLRLIFACIYFQTIILDTDKISFPPKGNWWREDTELNSSLKHIMDDKDHCNIYCFIHHFLLDVSSEGTASIMKYLCKGK